MRKIIPSLIIAFGATGLGLSAQEAPKRTPDRPGPGLSSPAERAAAPTPAPPARGDDEKAIEGLRDAFTRAFNAGDAPATADTYTETAIVVDEQGERIEGRAAIRDQYAAVFADRPGSKISIQVGTLRFLGPETAIEEGRSTMSPAAGAGAPGITRYTVVYIKHDGHWLASSVREESDPMVRPSDRLKDLEWMVGDWIDEASESVVRVHCGWSEDGNFLIRSFTVKRQGRTVMSVNQRIGWDPVVRRFRSWEFDSEGGFGEGQWSRDGDRWVVKQTGVRPEGTTASATNITSRVRPDLVRWVSVDRVIGDESLPDDEGYVLVRIPPAPRLRPNTRETSPPSPNTTRSPQ